MGYCQGSAFIVGLLLMQVANHHNHHHDHHYDNHHNQRRHHHNHDYHNNLLHIIIIIPIVSHNFCWLIDFFDVKMKPHIFGHIELLVATCKGSKLNSFGASQIGVICIMEDWNLIFNRYKNVTNQCFNKYWSLWQKEM